MRKICIVLFLLLAANIFAQTNLFAKKYAGTNTFRSYAIIQAKDSGFIYVGEHNNIASITKIDSVGNTVWSKQYALSGATSFIKNICRASDSCYVVVGIYNYSNNSPGQDVFCMKFKENGDTVWVKGIPSAGYGASSIQQTKDKGYIITSSDGLAVVTKLDSLGNFQWKKRLNSANHSNYGITTWQLPDSSYLALVYRETKISSIHMGHITLINLSKVGNVNWAKSYNRAIQMFNWGYDMLTVSDGVLIFGNINSAFRMCLLKIDFSGNVVWCKQYNLAGGNDYGTRPKIIRTTDGGYIFGIDRVIKVDSIGQPVWTNTWTVPQPLAPHEIIETKSKGVIAISNFYGSNFTDQTFIIKLDSLGNTPVCSNTASATYTIDSFIATSITPTVISGGSSINLPIIISTLVINVTSGCIPVYPWGINEVNKTESGLIISPNPSNGVFKIKTNEVSSYIITDGIGKLIANGICDKQATIDISNVANGIYILQIKDESGKTLDSRKLIKK